MQEKLKQLELLISRMVTRQKELQGENAALKARVRVLPTHESWFGVTYHEDKPMVVESIRALKDAGVYKERLWS